MPGPYHISGMVGKKCFLILTDDRARAIELAKLLHDSGKYDRVEIERDGKCFIYPNLENMK